MTLDPRLSSMRLAQLKLATELAARGWPPLVFSEVLPYPCVDNRGWLVVVETEAGEQIVIGFYDAVRYRLRGHGEDRAPQSTILGRLSAIGGTRGGDLLPPR